MKALIFISLVLALCSEGSGTVTSTNPVTQMKTLSAMQRLLGANAVNTTASEISVECGGILETVAGVISYKFDETLNGESCVWILRPGMKTAMYIRLIYAGFASIAKINVYNAAASGQITHIVTINRPTTVVRAVTGHTIYIHLTTYGLKTNETGFIMSYDGYGVDSKSGMKYSNYILSDAEDGGSYRHHLNGSTYLQNEFSSFLLYSNCRRTVSLTISNVDIPSLYGTNILCTGDVLNVYQVDDWDLHSRIRYCATDKGTLTLRSNSSLLVTFLSANRELAGRNGFQLEWRFESSRGNNSNQISR